MGNSAGEANDAVLRLDFDRRLMLQFHGSKDALKRLGALGTP